MIYFHMRLSCCHKIILFFALVILSRHNLAVEVQIKQQQSKSDKDSEDNDLKAQNFIDNVIMPKVKEISSNIFNKKLVPEENHYTTKKSTLYKKKVKLHAVNTKLLADNELKNGEILGKSDKQSADVIIKYGNGMFGLVDSERDLHVWRAPFSTLGQIWPHPRSVASSNNIFTICPSRDSLSFKVTGINNYIIQHAINRYQRIICDKMVSVYPSNWRQQEHLLDNISSGQKIFRTTPENLNKYFDHSHYFSAIFKGQLTSVKISVESSGHQWPSLYMNESYRLSVDVTGVSIKAKETWGVLRALESLSQLVWRTKAGRVFINETKIADEPRFKHRGMMLDTARHFVPKGVILKNLDAMAMNKYNVFHWHISDDQSFPLETDNHPEFARHGSYDFQSKVYHPDDVREILEYARLRGIRVIPELDSPSHSLSWRKSHPEVMTRCIDNYGAWTGYYGPLNMAAAATYRLLKSLYTDIVHLFPDQWIHLGSDEVPNTCIMSNPAIQKWMKSINMYSTELLTDFYTRKLQNIITEIGRNRTKYQRGFIVWQEAYERNSALKSGTIVQLWKSSSTSEAAMLAQQKIFVIYSSCWYLDRLEYGAQWVTHYQCDPGDDLGLMNGREDSWQQYILGGETAMWMEFFDADNVLQRIWPLANAAAERLWSTNKLRDAEKAAPRMEEMRCRMLMRAIPIGVASGAGDCGQGSESSAMDSFNYRSYGDSVIFLSDASSVRLVYQLVVNFFNRTYLILILLVAVVICIYLHRQLKFPKQRVMLLVIVVLGVYTLFWIMSQLMVLHS